MNLQYPSICFLVALSMIFLTHFNASCQSTATNGNNSSSSNNNNNGSFISRLDELKQVTLQRDVSVHMISIKRRRQLRMGKMIFQNNLYFTPEYFTLFPSESLTTNYTTHFSNIDIDFVTPLVVPPPDQSRSIASRIIFSTSSTTQESTSSQQQQQRHISKKSPVEFNFNETIIFSYKYQDSLYSTEDFASSENSNMIDFDKLEGFLRNKAKIENSVNPIFLIGLEKNPSEFIQQQGEDISDNPEIETAESIEAHVEQNISLTAINRDQVLFCYGIVDNSDIRFTRRDQISEDIANSYVSQLHEKNNKVESQRREVLRRYANVIHKLYEATSSEYPELLSNETKLTVVLELDAFFEFEIIWQQIQTQAQSIFLLTSVNQFQKANQTIKKVEKTIEYLLTRFFREHLRGVTSSNSNKNNEDGENQEDQRQFEKDPFELSHPVVYFLQHYTFSILILCSILIFALLYARISGLFDLYNKKFV